MERRGADVTAMDFVPETYTGFATARQILGSTATYRMDNVYNLTPEAWGHFDVVLFKIGRAHVWNSSHGYISYAVFCLKKKTDSRLGPPCRQPRSESCRGAASTAG